MVLLVLTLRPYIYIDKITRNWSYQIPSSSSLISVGSLLTYTLVDSWTPGAFPLLFLLAAAAAVEAECAAEVGTGGGGAAVEPIPVKLLGQNRHSHQESRYRSHFVLRLYSREVSHGA